MIELSHPVYPIMAAEALCAILLAVLRHEFRIILCMTLCAAFQRKCIILHIWMAIDTQHGVHIVMEPVVGQAETQG